MVDTPRMEPRPPGTPPTEGLLAPEPGATRVEPGLAKRFVAAARSMGLSNSAIGSLRGLPVSLALKVIEGEYETQRAINEAWSRHIIEESRRAKVTHERGLIDRATDPTKDPDLTAQRAALARSERFVQRLEGATVDVTEPEMSSATRASISASLEPSVAPPHPAERHTHGVGLRR